MRTAVNANSFFENILVHSLRGSFNDNDEYKVFHPLISRCISSDTKIQTGFGFVCDLKGFNLMKKKCLVVR